MSKPRTSSNPRSSASVDPTGSDWSQTERLIERVNELTALVDENERNQQIQRAVFQIAKIATDSEDMDSFYESLHQIVQELTSIDAFLIALYHKQEECISFPYYEDQFDDVQTSADTPLKNRGMIPIEKCREMLTWRTISTNEVVRVIDTEGENNAGFGKNSTDWLGIPLQNNGHAVGVFSIQSYQPNFKYTDEEVDLMVFISQHIASALQHRSDAEAIKLANDNLRASAAELEVANERLKQQIEEREKVNQRMIELSHQAGKAEIATGVLHNVGNVLNSINVSAGLVEESLRMSHLGSLSKAAILLEEQADLYEFFKDDPRGKAFSPYLSKLSTVLSEEQDKATEELATLKSHLEHVKTVVAMQQNYAGVSGLKVPVSLPELFYDAEVLIASSLTRHEVSIDRQFDDLPELLLEKQKLLQVIVNLLKNAKDSMTTGRGSDRQLTIRIYKQTDSTFRIDVQDNGEGIAPENLVNIFSHGFTTKADGHGFGLHSSANTIREMGGNLSVTSEGVGMGAVFSIELPFMPATN